MGETLKAHYALLLGLDQDWEVGGVDLQLEKKRVEIQLRFVGGKVSCPCCEKAVGRADFAPERTWRHLDTMQFETCLKTRVPRSNCKDCGVKVVDVPWAGKQSSFTWMFEAMVVQLFEAARCIESTRKLVKLDWHAVQRILDRAVKRGLLRRDLSGVKKLGLDEKSFLRGHSYVVCTVDLEQHRVIDVQKDRTEEQTRSLLQRLPEKIRKQVKAVALDMWPAFANAVRSELPEAELVYDRFHVSKHMGEAVDAVRRNEHKDLLKSGNKSLTGTRYSWLKCEENIKGSQREVFDQLKKSELKTARAWAIKELLREFWNSRNEGFAKVHFEQWYGWAIRSRLGPVKKVARMLKKHLEGLLAYFRHWITNAASEGFNSKIQSIKSSARGFRNFENYRTRILFFCGRLDMRLEKTH